MKNHIDFLEEVPALPVKLNFFPETQSNPSNEIEPIFLIPFGLNSQETLPPKKNLFHTKKEKTSFITFKRGNSKSVKKSNDNSVSKGRWTQKERILFAFALYKFGTDWKKIKNYISTRNMIQLRSHAQKFLEKLKYDNFIIQKGLDFKNYSWKESIQYLKENLTEVEFFNILYSIESELGDNNRMTEKYLKKKILNFKNNSNSIEETSNTALSSYDERNMNYSQSELDEGKQNDENENNYFTDIISIVEEDDYKNSLYKNFFGQKYDSAHNMFKKDLFSFQENIDSEQGNLECKCKLNSLFKL